VADARRRPRDDNRSRQGSTPLRVCRSITRRPLSTLVLSNNRTPDGTSVEAHSWRRIVALASRSKCGRRRDPQRSRTVIRILRSARAFHLRSGQPAKRADAPLRRDCPEVCPESSNAAKATTRGGRILPVEISHVTAASNHTIGWTELTPGADLTGAR
jgi:hypothetical protein